MTPKTHFIARMALTWPTALACVMLAGCGPSTGIAGKILARVSPAPYIVPVRVDKDAPMIDVTIPSRGVAGAMARVAVRGDVSEWRSADGIGLTLRGTQIIATRGFGPDLLIGDAHEALSALRQGGGTFSRKMHWLDGENHDQSEIFACTLLVDEAQANPAERALRETCAGPQTTFTNTYAVSAHSGAVVRSDQWVSPRLGNIEIQFP